jgi:hypothetical protein
MAERGLASGFGVQRHFALALFCAITSCHPKISRFKTAYAPLTLHLTGRL